MTDVGCKFLSLEWIRFGLFYFSNYSVKKLVFSETGQLVCENPTLFFVEVKWSEKTLEISTGQN